MQFEWDAGNWPKCGQHGLSKDEIEFALSADPFVQPDPKHSEQEDRFIAFGQNAEGRYVFIAFCMRGGALRPIMARYMHRREVERFIDVQATKEEKG